MSRPQEIVVDGTVVRLSEVRVSPDADRLDVWLEIDDSRTFAAQLARWRADLEVWGANRDAAGQPIGDPPPQPAEYLLGIDVALSDDCGTFYQWHSKQAGGSDTERQGRWSWRPAPPQAARLLTIDLPAGQRWSWSRDTSGAWRAID